MCGYRKGYSTQYALVALIEGWRDSLDKGWYAGAMLMDLSKTFDTIDHKLLIAKLHAYGLNKSSLLLIIDYLSERLKELKQILILAHGLIQTKGSHKDQFWDLCYLTYI